MFRLVDGELTVIQLEDFIYRPRVHFSGAVRIKKG